MNDAIPLARAVRRAGFRIRQRGFTLVELAIALTVVGLVLGASIIPLRMLDEARQLQDERRRLETVRDAIVGYALRHRTRELTIQFWQIAPDDRPVGEFRLPAGRPYLPCPDSDGDGFEDRRGFNIPLEDRFPTLILRTDPDRTIQYVGDNGFSVGSDSLHGRGRALFFGFRLDLNPNSSSLLPRPPYGECWTSRGTVPWRTLGIDPSDGWGNRHTYFADPVFSNAMFGFDRQTIADASDPRVPSAPGFGTARYANIGSISTDSVRTNGCPAVICDGGRTRTLTPAGTDLGCATAWGDLRPICRAFSGYLTPKSDDLILKAGAVARTTITAPPGGKPFWAGEVTDGLPFVLVSHGPNGRFAVNHWATLTDPGVQSRSGENFSQNICNSAGERDVLFNELRTPITDERALALAHEAMNGNRDGLSSDEGCLVRGGARDGPGLSFHLSFFAWEPPGVSRRGEFDDLLLWMTREELSLAAPGKIPPLPPMVIAYFP